MAKNGLQYGNGQLGHSIIQSNKIVNIIDVNNLKLITFFIVLCIPKHYLIAHLLTNFTLRI